MIRMRRVHRTDDRDVVDALCRFRKQRADFGAATTVRSEFPLRSFQVDLFVARSVFDFRMIGLDLLAVIASQRWFRIPRVNVRNAARHKQKDDSPGLRGEVSLVFCQRIVTIGQ